MKGDKRGSGVPETPDGAAAAWGVGMWLLLLATPLLFGTLKVDGREFSLNESSGGIGLLVGTAVLLLSHPVGVGFARRVRRAAGATLGLSLTLMMTVLAVACAGIVSNPEDTTAADLFRTAAAVLSIGGFWWGARSELRRLQQSGAAMPVSLPAVAEVGAPVCAAAAEMPEEQAAEVRA
jgi:hypothetical protein